MKGVKWFLILGIMLLVLLSSNVFGLKGSISNARMVLNTEVIPGVPTYLEETIKVNNNNNVSVNIVIKPFGNFSDMATIIDDEFTLAPGESKRSKFRVKLTEPGTYEGKIGVAFAPLEGGSSGVGLQSIITIYASKSNETGPVVDPKDPDEPGSTTVTKKPVVNPFVGILIILVIAAIGVIIYLLVTKKV